MILGRVALKDEQKRFAICVALKRNTNFCSSLVPFLPYATDALEQSTNKSSTFDHFLQRLFEAELLQNRRFHIALVLWRISYGAAQRELLNIKP